MFTSISSRIPIASVRRRGAMGSIVGSQPPASGSSALIDFQTPNLNRFTAFKTIGTFSFGPPTGFGAWGTSAFNGVVTLGRPDGAGAVNAAIMSWASNAADIAFAGAISIGNAYTARDLYIYRDAADTLALRRTSNPQTFRAYNTYTDASNYERAFLRWSSNVLEIGCEAAGTGVQRQLSHPLGTVTASTPMLITQTWNNAGTTFNSLLLNITDTASATASTLLDLQVGGASVCSVRKDYTLSLRGGSALIQSPGSNQLRIGTAGSYCLGVTTYNTVEITGSLTLTGSSPGGAIGDVSIVRDAADTLALRRTSNSQTFRVYNTYTSSSDYERAFMRWNSSVLEIGAEALGSGIQRQLSHPLGTTTVDIPLSITQTWNSAAIATTAASGTGTAATLTFAAQTVAYPVGSTIVVAGVTPTGYNGTYVVTASTVTSVTYANATTGAQTVAGTVQQQQTGIRYNVTDTASSAASILFDLQVGGSSKFSVQKSGAVAVSGQLSCSSSIKFTSGTLILSESSGSNVAIRSGSTAQAFRVYNTYSSDTSYERALFSWSSNEFLLGTEKGSGGGTARPLKIQTDGTTRAGVTTTGSVYIGSGAASLATTATDGFLYLPSCAGAPTGVPTAITGSLPAVIDSTNSKLYIYSGGAWNSPGAQFNTLIQGSATFNVGSLAKTAVTNLTFTITGVTTGHSIIVMPDVTLAYGVLVVGAACTAANTVTIRFSNSTGGAITPGNVVFDYIAWIP